MQVAKQVVRHDNVSQRDTDCPGPQRARCFFNLHRGILPTVKFENATPVNDASMDPATDQNPPAEGVIQFAYDLQPADGAPISAENFAQMAAWRSILRQLDLLGQDPLRYAGLGFGNLSARDPQQPEEFVITASQSSGADALTEKSLVRVLHCNLGRFWVDAQGSHPPSSETLTHGMIYAADSAIHWIFHCHSPEIWNRAEDLALPCTPENVELRHAVHDGGRRPGAAATQIKTHTLRNPGA